MTVVIGHLDDRAAWASVGAGNASHCCAGSGASIVEVTELLTGGALNQLGMLLEAAIRRMAELVAVVTERTVTDGSQWGSLQHRGFDDLLNLEARLVSGMLSVATHRAVDEISPTDSCDGSVDLGSCSCCILHSRATSLDCELGSLFLDTLHELGESMSINVLTCCDVL